MEEDVTVEEFADYVRFMRQSVQMTQRQLGEAIGFERRTIMNWENGKSLPFDIYAVIESIRNEVKLRIKYKAHEKSQDYS